MRARSAWLSCVTASTIRDGEYRSAIHRRLLNRGWIEIPLEAPVISAVPKLFLDMILSSNAIGAHNLRLKA
jgi:hypothetical protein